MPKRRVVERELVVQPQDQSIRYIALTHAQIAIVDKELFDRVDEFWWHAFWNKSTQSWYARRGHGGPFLHNFVTNTPSGNLVDHINHNTLDCRLKNLRPATHSQNMMNRRAFKNNKSGYPGVCWHARDLKWSVYIDIEKKRICLGYFAPDKIEDAIAARKAAEEMYHGEFAYKGHHR